MFIKQRGAARGDDGRLRHAERRAGQRIFADLRVLNRREVAAFRELGVVGEIARAIDAGGGEAARLRLFHEIGHCELLDERRDERIDELHVLPLPRLNG